MLYEASTPRLWLERLSEKHLDDFHALWSSKESCVWSRRLPFITRQQSWDHMQGSLHSVHPENDKFAIILKPIRTSTLVTPVEDNGQMREEDENPRMIGLIGTHDDAQELVYMLHCDYWRKGYMSEAMVALLGTEGLVWRLESRKNVQTVKAYIDTENVGSIKTIQKVGAKEGELFVGAYGLGRDMADGVVPANKKRDLRVWYIDRPGEYNTRIIGKD